MVGENYGQFQYAIGSKPAGKDMSETRFLPKTWRLVFFMRTTINNFLEKESLSGATPYSSSSEFFLLQEPQKKSFTQNRCRSHKEWLSIMMLGATSLSPVSSKLRYARRCIPLCHITLRIKSSVPLLLSAV